MNDEARRAAETLSRSGRPSAALARVQRYLGDPAYEATFRATADRLAERAAGLLGRDGPHGAARAVLSAAEAALGARDPARARALLAPLLPVGPTLGVEERGRLAAALLRAADPAAAAPLVAALPESPARTALQAALDRSPRGPAAAALAAALAARPDESARPWADSAWWDVVAWLREEEGG